MKLSTLLAVLRGLTNQQVDNMFVGSSANQDVRQHQSPRGLTGIISSFRCLLYFLLVFVSVFVYLTRTTNPLQVYGTSKKSVPEFGGSTPNLGETQEGNKVYNRLLWQEGFKAREKKS